MENREIKFRAWDVAKKEMICHGAFQFEQFPTTGLQPENNRQLVFPFAGIESGEMITDRPLEAWKVMQYTGLKDKNGKEIYEGDVISIPRVSGPEARRGKVVYKEGEYVIECKESDDRLGIYCRNNAYQPISIIGNMYEQPELLTQLNKAEE